MTKKAPKIRINRNSPSYYSLILRISVIAVGEFVDPSYIRTKKLARIIKFKVRVERYHTWSLITTIKSNHYIHTSLNLAYHRAKVYGQISATSFTQTSCLMIDMHFCCTWAIIHVRQTRSIDCVHNHGPKLQDTINAPKGLDKRRWKDNTKVRDRVQGTNQVGQTWNEDRGHAGKKKHHLGTNGLGPNVDPPRCSAFYGDSSYSPGNEAVSHPFLPFYSTGLPFLSNLSIDILPMGLRSFLKNTKSRTMGSYGDNHTMLLLYVQARPSAVTSTVTSQSS